MKLSHDIWEDQKLVILRFNCHITKISHCRYHSLASGIYGICFGISGLWGNIIGSAFLNPWSLEKHNIDSSAHTGDYVFTDVRVLNRVPYSWLILAGLEFVLLLPGLILIDEEDPEDATEYTVFEDTLTEAAEIKNTAPKQKLSHFNSLRDGIEPGNSAFDNTVLEKRTSKVSKPILGRATLIFNL